jgi:uncharacterized protein YraI
VNSEYVLFRGVIDAVPVVSATIGQIDLVAAIISGSVTVYAAPGVNFGVVGVIQGPTELPIVARTSDSVWLQINSPLGFGWVLSSQVPVRGDLSLVPVVT